MKKLIDLSKFQGEILKATDIYSIKGSGNGEDPAPTPDNPQGGNNGGGGD